MCKQCKKTFKSVRKLRRHQQTTGTSKPFKCTKCDKTFNNKGEKDQHNEKLHDTVIRVASINICSGLLKKEETILATMQQFNFGIVFLHEVEARDFDEKRPFTLQGYKTYFPKKGKDIKRTLCFVRNDIEGNYI